MTFRTPLEDLTKAYDEIHDAEDRTTAIVGAAILEAILEDSIVERLVPMSNTHRDSLFEGEAGFAGFAAKINLGFSLGLYGVKTKVDLNLIRKVRNEFAHHIGRDFAHPAVKKFASQITQYNKASIIEAEKDPVVVALWADRDLRWRYVFACTHIVSGLIDELKTQSRPPDPHILP